MRSVTGFDRCGRAHGTPSSGKIDERPVPLMVRLNGIQTRDLKSKPRRFTLSEAAWVPQAFLSHSAIDWFLISHASHRLTCITRVPKTRALSALGNPIQGCGFSRHLQLSIHRIDEVCYGQWLSQGSVCA